MPAFTRRLAATCAAAGAVTLSAGAFALASAPSAHAAEINKDMSFGCNAYLGTGPSPYQVWYKPGAPGAGADNQAPFPVSISATAPDAIYAGQSYSTSIAAKVSIPAGLSNATRELLQGKSIAGTSTATVIGVVNGTEKQTITGKLNIPSTPVPTAKDSQIVTTATGSASGLSAKTSGELVISAPGFTAQTVVTKADGSTSDVFLDCSAQGSDVVGTLTVLPAQTTSPTTTPTSTPTTTKPTTTPTGTGTTTPTGTGTTTPTGTGTTTPTGTGTGTTTATGTGTTTATGTETATGPDTTTGPPIITDGGSDGTNANTSLIAGAGVAAAGVGVLAYGARRRLGSRRK
ncbi:hypothetical protein HJ588_01595 [Flexivirga sp. ID2601S]|uniref:DUF6801 domain-containing protein n=1 Tax=Flexivirga aerilata TaxID=1656889 RepID=A0A849AHR1_9MICO|nr:DUF6801 domain-containing protein [Flexivirga aerilata]NNG37970.1 hypothetical protein [Flexivirga aerilata]